MTAQKKQCPKSHIFPLKIRKSFSGVLSGYNSENICLNVLLQISTSIKPWLETVVVIDVDIEGSWQEVTWNLELHEILLDQK